MFEPVSIRVVYLVFSTLLFVSFVDVRHLLLGKERP